MQCRIQVQSPMLEALKQAEENYREAMDAWIAGDRYGLDEEDMEALDAHLTEANRRLSGLQSLYKTCDSLKSRRHKLNTKTY